jgi:putative flippase GtrA
MNGLRLIRRHAAAFGRFAGLGSGVTLAASAALVLLSQWIPWMAANALTTVASTVVATELHARVSFGHGRPGLAGHLKSAATMALGWLLTSAAVGSLAALRPGAGLVLQQTVYLSATALVGIGRYLVLRLAVFAERGPGPAAACSCGPRTTRRREGRRESTAARGRGGRRVPRGSAGVGS